MTDLARRTITHTDLISLYDELPFQQHPLWRAVREGHLTRDQIVLAETQHYVRTREGQKLRREAVTRATPGTRTFDLLFATYLDECVDTESNENHLALVQRILIAGGITDNELKLAEPNGPNAAAIALYKDISARGVSCHLLGSGAVEYHYARLTGEIFDAYVGKYGFTPEEAETYRLHGGMDVVHAERAFAVLDEAIETVGAAIVQRSVRDAFVATSLHYDAMLFAATGELSYWNGRD